MSESSYEGDLPNRTPQAPRSISAAEADLGSAVGRANDSYNPGAECGHMVGNPGVGCKKASS